MIQPTVLLITEVFPPQTGGSGRWFWEMYRRLPQDRVIIAAGEHPAQAAFDGTHDLHLVRMPLAMASWGTLGLRGLSGYLDKYRRIRRLVRQHGIGQIHGGRLLPEGWIAWLLKQTTGIPYLCYVHGEELSYGHHGRELGWMMRRVFRSAERIIANSGNTARLLHDGWQVPEARIAVLHPGVDIQRFVPAARSPDVRRQLGWEGRPVVLTVGRLQRRKGQDMLTRALPAVRQAVPDVLYAIVGDGDERPELERLVSELQLEDHVRFHGELSDDGLVSCYQQCDLFALPNREVDGDIEGFGMVLLEAQACGKPVLAGASGGTAETMRPDVTGFVMRCERPEPLAQAVVELLRSPQQREAMGQAARQWTVDNFSWESLTRQAAELFQAGRAAE